ncbi:ligand-binding sensor domain-containing protein [Acidicapsa ligni]|uniref:ligand-binding sensor domain-containing protein n=1 Tax=Acidicapsa ligni TaxID=542300 RepID=UPI0021E06E75|nr:sensor histidine kinase [Acidicapsa ligni]
MSQYRHSVWKLQDGFFNSRPYAVAQTSDGYLWIGTMDGLVRFDGVRFVPYVPEPGDQVSSLRTLSLLGARDGSLWIGTDFGLVHLVGHKLVQYPDSMGRIDAVIERLNGEVWFSRHLLQDPDNVAFCKVVGLKTQCYDRKDGVPLQGGATLMEDASGSLWIGDTVSLTQWRPGSVSTLRLRGLQENPSQGVMAIATLRNGTVLAGISPAGPGLGLEQVVHGALKPFLAPGLDGSSLDVTVLLSDRQGSLWIGTEAQGIYRIRNGKIDRFRSSDGLSGDYIVAFYEDNDGDVWAATTKGLDCFRDLRVTNVPGLGGLGTDEVDSVLATHDGTIWAGGSGDLGSIRNGTISSLQTKKGLPGDQVTSLLEDDRNRLWVGIDNTLNIYENGMFRRINKPDGSPLGFVVGLAEDTKHTVWAEISGSPRRLVQIKNDTVQQEFLSTQVPAARKVAAAPDGALWLGLISGDLGRYANGKLDIFHFGHTGMPGETSRFNQLFVGSDGSVMGATSTGVVAWKNGKQLTMTVKNGLPCDDIQALITDDHGDLWLYAQCGLIDIPRVEVEEWWAKSDSQVQFRLLDSLDGTEAGYAPFNGAAKSPDGHLWFVNGVVLQTVDPSHRMSDVVPPVYVEDMVVDRQTYAVTNGLRLPPIKNELEIDYTAPSFAMPQKIRFRYILHGGEKMWHDAGSRRQAFYNNLSPGKYRFQVIASNSDGVWNTQGTSLSFEVLPAWYQTRIFFIACLVTAICFIWVIYRIRVLQMAKVIGARFDERLSERTRMARELHDTFLQTIQGSKFVVDDGLEEPLNAEKMHGALKQVSGWLEQAIAEGRATLNSLRSSTTLKNELGPALRRAAENGVVPERMTVSVSIIGDARELHPIVRDELYRIGYEAIQNAKAHSHGSRLSIDLTYGQNLTLHVGDNGVGIDPGYAASGREDHHGLQGMRERAARIQGRLTILSSTESGTDISVIVPGNVSFLNPDTGIFANLRRLYRRTIGNHEM